MQGGTGGDVMKLYTCLRETASAKAGQKRSNDQLPGCRQMKRLHLQQTRLPITLKDRILKLRSLRHFPAHVSPS